MNLNGLKKNKVYLFCKWEKTKSFSLDMNKGLLIEENIGNKNDVYELKIIIRSIEEKYMFFILMINLTKMKI